MARTHEVDNDYERIGTMSTLDEETLLAYVDGQLDPARAAEVEARLADDPEARETVRVFRESAALLHGRFDAPLHQPIPERLLATLRDTPAGGDETRDDDKVVSLTKRRRPVTFSAPTLAMAAGLALVIGFGGGYLTLGLPGGDPDAAFLQQVLDGTASGVTVNTADAQLTPMATFRTTDGRYCREYEKLTDRASTGIACRDADGRWQPQIEVAQTLLGRSGDAQYAPASGPDIDPLAEAGLALGAERSLTPEQEQVLLRNGWQSE